MAPNYFTLYQADWVFDFSPLKIIQKSRQIGITYADAYNSVLLASDRNAQLDIWISSRDETQAKLYLEDCKFWADFLHLAATDLGEVLLDRDQNISARVLEFTNGRRIYCLSSNPNALAGKRGHVKLDEFALHPDQRLLYRVAKPVTQWGGSLSIISTHRGANTLFNQIIQQIQEAQRCRNAIKTGYGSPSPVPLSHRIGEGSRVRVLGSGEGRGGGEPLTDPPHDPAPRTSDFALHWSLHTVPIQKAVKQGIVERINQKSGRHESRRAFLKRLEAECIDQEQWLQEYCCIPADESTAFISHDMIHSCENPALRLMSFPQLRDWLDHQQSTNNHQPSLYLGVDVARKHDLCVLDVGEKIGDVTHDRLRLELKNKTFNEIERELYPLIKFPQLKRTCIDAIGMDIQLAERAQHCFGWKVEPITFTAPVKEELAFGLRADLEDKRLRIVRDDNLRADLRAMKKEVSLSGNIRFVGESDDSHCDRFWAMALRQHAQRFRLQFGAAVA
jgi:phage FluMu gp28-like protein